MKGRACRKNRSRVENENKNERRMPYTIRIYKPRETFRMHIRLERWPTVDFLRGRELTFALPLCANSHKDSLSADLLLILSPPLPLSFSLPFSRLSSLPRPILFQPSTPLSASYTNFSPRRLCNVRVHRQFNFFVICVWTKEFAWKLPGKWFLQEIVELNAV